MAHERTPHRATTTPARLPAAGEFLDYYKADGKLYRINSAGVEIEIGPGSGGGGSAAVEFANVFLLMGA